MRATPPSSSTDRRTEAGLQFEPATGRLALGSESVIVPPEAGNRVILVAYVDLAAKCRNRSVAEVTEVRQADIDALAAALDLDAAGLDQQIQQVLGATRAEAIRLVTRLKHSRVIGGITKAATAAAVVGVVVTGAGAATSHLGSAPASATPAPAASATTSTTDMTAAGGWQDDTEPVIDGPLTVDASGVGLIPAVTEEADGTVMIPPATLEHDDPAGS